MRSALGVNVDDLLVSQPDTGEQALEIVGHVGTFGRGGCSGCGFGRSAHPKGRDRRGNGRYSCGTTGPIDVPRRSES